MGESAQMYIGGLLTGGVLYFAAQMILLTIRIDIAHGRQVGLLPSHKTQEEVDDHLRQMLKEQILPLHETGHLLYIQMQEILDRLASLPQFPNENHYDSELRKLVTDEYDSLQSRLLSEVHCSMQRGCLHETDDEPQPHSASQSK